MKKTGFLFLILMLFFLFSCSKSFNNQIDINLILDDYIVVSVEDTMTFEFSQTINIDSTYEIISIERLKNDFGVFPYESDFIQEKEFKDYLGGLEIYINQFTDDSLLDSNQFVVGPKAKLIIVLSDGNSDITIEFYQNNAHEICASKISYVDYQNIEFIHYFNDDDPVLYESINELIWS